MDNTLKDRVKKFLVNERISNSKFSEMAGVSEAYVNSIKKNLSFEILSKLYSINPRVSLAWLMWGVGEMYHDHSALKTLQDENAQLKEKVAMLEKIVMLYERNENAKK